MRRYFDLSDDMGVHGRWHLAEILLPSGEEPRLDGGVRIDTQSVLEGAVFQSGRVLDFSLTSFNVPVATPQLAEAIASVAGTDVQALPLRIAGQSGLVALNSVRVIRCLDEARSEFLKWTSDDHRPDLAGTYREVTRLVLDPNMIPLDAHFFRVEAWEVALIVSGETRDAMVRAGCVGAKFVDVTPAERSMST